MNREDARQRHASWWRSTARWLGSERVERRAIVCLLLCIIAILFVAASNQPQFRQALRFATTHQPERLTELYFSNPQTLPSAYHPGEKIAVAFVIHNMEGTTKDYPYTIELQAPRTDIVAAHGSVRIFGGRRAKLTVPIAIRASAPRIAVVVLLPTKQQSLHFWLQKA